jgi:hypothetical protein
LKMINHIFGLVAALTNYDMHVIGHNSARIASVIMVADNLSKRIADLAAL